MDTDKKGNIVSKKPNIKKAAPRSHGETTGYTKNDQEERNKLYFMVGVLPTRQGRRILRQLHASAKTDEEKFMLTLMLSV